MIRSSGAAEVVLIEFSLCTFVATCRPLTGTWREKCKMEWKCQYFFVRIYDKLIGAYCNRGIWMGNQLNESCILIICRSTWTTSFRSAVCKYLIVMACCRVAPRIPVDGPQMCLHYYEIVEAKWGHSQTIKLKISYIDIL